MSQPVVSRETPDITLDEILSIKHPGAAAWSADGEWLAWGWNDGGIVQLWAARVDNGTPVQVSQGEATVGGFHWSPDGHGRLAYSQGGDIWTAAPGQDEEPRQLTQGGGKDSLPRWSPSGKQLAFTRDGQLLVYDFEATLLIALDIPGTVTPGYADPATMYWSPDGSRLAVTVVDGAKRDLAVVELDGALRWRTDNPDTELAAIWLDNTRLHYTAIDSSHCVRTHHVVDVETGDDREVAREVSERGIKGEIAPTASPDRSTVVYAMTPENWPHLFELDIASGELRQLTFGDCDDTGHAADFYTFSPDGSKLVYCSNRDTDLNQRRLWTVDVASAESTLLTPGPGTDSCAAWSPDGRHIAYVHCGPFESADIWVVDVESGEQRQISHSMPETLTREKITTPQHLTYPSSDGLEVHADLFLPKGFDENERYPAVVWVHGGMARQMRYGWHPMHSYAAFYSFDQYLLHRGYVVLSVDYRGSIGYGREYEEGTYLSMCQAELADVVAGSTYLRSLPYIDPEAIAVYGLSYGGYMTLGALTKHPDAYALGINIAGVWDWEQYTDWRRENFPGSDWHGTARLGGLKGEHNAEVWYQASPRNFVEGLSAPLLTLMGTDDERVDFAQTDQIIRDCVAHGKDFATAYYPDETHMFTHRRTWADAFPRIEQALERYLKTEPAKRPRAMI